MARFFKQKNKGFTLLETLVAITIFTGAVMAMTGVLARGIADTGYAKKKITATYLAQEGVEYMRNLRDTYVLYTIPASNGWTAFNAQLTNASCNTANGCFFNADALDFTNPIQPMTNITFTACSGATCSNGVLSYNSATGTYGFTGTASGYTRKINMTVVNANETQISSTVSWSQGSGIYDVVLRENLFNWVE